MEKDPVGRANDVDAFQVMPPNSMDFYDPSLKTDSTPIVTDNDLVSKPDIARHSGRKTVKAEDVKLALKQ